MSNVAASLPLMLKSLRLASMQKQWRALAEKAVSEHWAPEQYLVELCTIELATREDKRLHRYLKEATLPPGKQLGDFDFHAVEGVTQQHVRQLIN
ncbi:ATP-binding protein, partial [Gilvimarinus sp. DZF01]|uniref:ATP-binding protein n=1 Tax=Gilvimarinus sp. DZF01 TaxID=3461371 RepID=UPI004045ADFA